jgi:hypothetical protein
MIERFKVVEVGKCSCGARRFEVTDWAADGEVVPVHVGHLNPRDLAHNAVADLLAAERLSSRAGDS